jgi:uncharacterized protein YciI
MSVPNSPLLQERLKSMLNAEVVAILSRPRASFDPGKMLPSHLDFMVGLEKRGLLFLSGPLTARDGKFGAFGLTVLNVNTIVQAEGIWADEPFNKSGQRDAEYFVWRLMEGRLMVTLDLSDRRFNVS